MALGHERLDVYRLAIRYVAWVYEKAVALEGVHRAARDQWLRASQSIVRESGEAYTAGGAEVDPDPDPDPDSDSDLNEYLSRDICV